MFKMKNLKILLLLMLFAFAGNNAWAFGPKYYHHWYRFQAEVKAQPTGAAKVYGAFPDSNGSISFKENVSTCHKHFDDREDEPVEGVSTGDLTAYLRYDNVADGYRFLHWIDSKGNIITTFDNTQQAYTATVTSDNLCFTEEYGTTYKKNDDGTIDYTTTYNKGVKRHRDADDAHPYYTNETFTAVFERLTTDPVVTVSTEGAEDGQVSAKVSPEENAVGDEVTISTQVNSDASLQAWKNKFLGWKFNGEFIKDGQGNIIRDVSYTFTITEDNKGEYVAVYEGDYSFFRIKCLGSPHRYASAIKDGINYTSLDLSDNIKLSNTPTSYLPDAGTVLQFDYKRKPSGYSGSYHEVYVQNIAASNGYNFAAGSYIRITYIPQSNTYLFSTVATGGTRFRDKNGTPTLSDIEDEYGYWYIEPMDKDLKTCENYFSLDPNKLVEVDGKYYTTLRTSWNILFNPEQMTPYVVTEVDEENGTFDMEPIAGNIIPAGTPVIIETKSNDVEENRMVPTLTNAANGAVPSGNLLQHSEKYFPNQSVNTSDNYKGLTLVNGKIGFGGNALSTIDGNHGYLQLPGDAVLKIPEVTLAELLASGDTQRTYNITDLTAIELVEQGRMLICKDNGGYAKKDKKSDEEYIDFMHTATLTNGIQSTIPADYDQSNWIGLRLSDDKELSYLLKSYPLKGVVGKLTSTVNPEFILEQAPEADGEALSFTPNVYIAASFNSVNHQSGKNGKEYFFVVPKPMEYANVEWAQWDGEKFIAPVHDASHPEWNQNELRGEFEFNGSYLEQGGVFLEAGHSYEMLPAIIKYNDGINNAHVYVLGNVNGQGWSPRKGVEMSTRDGKIYTTTVTVDNAGEGYGYFSFSKKLDPEWDNIKDYRFGAVAEGENYYVDPNYLGNELPLAYWSSDSRSFQLAQGTYRLMVNLSTLKLVITPAQTGAPGLKGTTNGYVVYPLQINKVTTEENGVITALEGLVAGKAVARVVYYNMMGVESDVPHRGINIVVTEYSDGSRTAVKMLR